MPFSPISVGGGGDDDDCSKPMPTRTSLRRPPSDDASARGTSSAQRALSRDALKSLLRVLFTRSIMRTSRLLCPDTVSSLAGRIAQVLHPDSPCSILLILLGFSIMRRPRLLPHGASYSTTHDLHPSAANARHHGTTYFGGNDNQLAAANQCALASLSAATAANPRRLPTSILKKLLLMASGGSTLGTPTTMALNGPQYQYLLAIPIMAALHKIYHIKSWLNCSGALPYLIASSKRGAGVATSLSSKLAEGSFGVRICKYILGLFKLEVLWCVSLSEFIGLGSTFFRHTSSVLKTVSDILNKVNELCVTNSANSHILPESRSEEEISSGQHGFELKIISSTKEAEHIISLWKQRNARIFVEVPPDMSVEAAFELKGMLRQAGALHLLQGAIIKSKLEKSSVSETSELEVGIQNVEEHQQPSQPSFSTDGRRDQ